MNDNVLRVGQLEEGWLFFFRLTAESGTRADEGKKCQHFQDFKGLIIPHRPEGIVSVRRSGASLLRW